MNILIEFWLLCLLVWVLVINSCGKDHSTIEEPLMNGTSVSESDLSFPVIRKYSETELRLIAEGLENVQKELPLVKINVVYATTNNFTGLDLYGDFDQCYLRPEAMEKLKTAFTILTQKRPGYSFMIYDTARPNSVQIQMWDLVEGTDWEGYVANPLYGSIHSYGCAVDLSVIDKNGNLLDMGTPFDSFELKAQPKYEEQYLAEGLLTAEQVSNRLLLRETMIEAGFNYIRNEWWHFNAFPRAEVKERFELIP